MRQSVIRVGEQRSAQGAIAVPAAAVGLPESVVFVIDGVPRAREMVAAQIEAVGLRASSFPSSGAFLDAFEPEVPGCVLVDVDQRASHGFELLTRLGGRDALLPVVLMTSCGDFNLAVRAFRAGASDVLEKPLEPQVIVERLQPLVEQDRARRIARAGRAAVLARLASLTARERMVLDGLLEGRTSKEIACGLDISTRTVETHRAHVLDKLDAGSTGHAVRMVLLATRTIGRSTP